MGKLRILQFQGDFGILDYAGGRELAQRIGQARVRILVAAEDGRKKLVPIARAKTGFLEKLDELA